MQCLHANKLVESHERVNNDERRVIEACVYATARLPRKHVRREEKCLLFFYEYNAYEISSKHPPMVFR